MAGLNTALVCSSLFVFIGYRYEEYLLAAHMRIFGEALLVQM